MRKNIITLVRVQAGETYVSRSFDKIDEKALETSKGCIKDDCDDWLNDKEIEENYNPSFLKLKKDYESFNAGEYDEDFYRGGDCIWSYFDGIESTKYLLHMSILETDTQDAKLGFKETIKAASEWWLKRLGGGQVSHDTDDIDDNGERVVIRHEWTDTLCADFEAYMNKLWEN